MDKKGIKKIFMIILIAVIMIGVASLLPDHVVENYMLPIISGMFLSSAIGKAPDLLINQILHVIVFLPLFILYVYFISLSAGLAYIAYNCYLESKYIHSISYFIEKLKMRLKIDTPIYYIIL